MTRHLFGWSLPPGCHTLPGEEPVGPCQCCGGDPEGDDDEEGGCSCPECPTCQQYGNPRCYQEHGLTYSAEQLKGQEVLAAELKAQDQADQQWADQFERESQLDSVTAEDLRGGYYDDADSWPEE